MDIQALKDTFEFFDDWEDKYRFVIDIGKDLPTLETSQRVEENIIRGCQSQVWLVTSCVTIPCTSPWIQTRILYVA